MCRWLVLRLQSTSTSPLVETGTGRGVPTTPRHLLTARYSAGTPSTPLYPQETHALHPGGTRSSAVWRLMAGKQLKTCRVPAFLWRQNARFDVAVPWRCQMLKVLEGDVDKWIIVSRTKTGTLFTVEHD